MLHLDLHKRSTFRAAAAGLATGGLFAVPVPAHAIRPPRWLRLPVCNTALRVPPR